MFASKDTLLTRPSGYQIQRSLRFRSSASAYLNRTPAGASNRKTWTWSGWVKVGTIGVNRGLFGAQTTAGADANRLLVWLNSSDKILVYEDISSTGNTYRLTTQVFRDPSAWYHIVLAFDTSNATAGDRVKLYVNGSQITTFDTNNAPTLNRDTFVNAALPHSLGADRAASLVAFDGYLAEVNFIDGQALTPASFGEINPVTGVWSAKKYAGTYGTNGFFLNFSDNSAATAAAIGKDSSGNGNNWTPNNISVTAGVTYDSMLDVPLGAGGAERGNYCVMNPLKLQSNMRLTNGNLDVSSTDGGSAYCAFSSIVMSSGSWYAEYTINTSSGNFPQAGVGDLVISPTSNQGLGDANGTAYQRDGRVIVSGSTIGTFATFTNGDVVGVAYDSTNNRIYFAKNNTWINSGNPSAGTGYFSPAAPNLGYVFGTATYSAGSCSINFGQRPFAYTPPTGFKALHTGNLPEPVIKQGASYMAATLYTGNSSTQTISNAVNGVSFQPDFVWIKDRSVTSQHVLTDSVRGVDRQLFSSLTNAEQTSATAITSLNSDGFTTGANPSPTGATNSSPDAYVGWQWKANGAAVSNTAGSITSQVSAGVSQGFSVVTYTGSGANATVGHGIGVAPQMVIVKKRNSTSDWVVYSSGLPSAAYRIYLNYDLAQDSGAAAAATWNSTAPTSTVFSIGTNTNSNASTDTYVAYCFAPVAGYSAFGSYTGNGSADGPFVYTGFRPRWVLIKGSSFGSNWFVIDTSRSSYNVSLDALRPNLSGAETSTGTYSIDILSNGFKLRTNAADPNTNAATFIYAAFAESPFKNSLAR